MKMDNSKTICPMFCNKINDKFYFYMGETSFYVTNDEMDAMKNYGMSEESILTYVYETLLNKRLADFSDLVPLFQNRFN